LLPNENGEEATAETFEWEEARKARHAGAGLRFVGPLRVVGWRRFARNDVWQGGHDA
jgi:hypothetical protein